jgi:hypothetical protein
MTVVTLPSVVMVPTQKPAESGASSRAPQAAACKADERRGDE